jgi:RHS repeat-associated protein
MLFVIRAMRGFAERNCAPTALTAHHYLSAGGKTIGVITQTSAGVNSVRYFHTDHLGSIVAITGTGGATVAVERFSYDPFGKRRSTNGTDDAGSYQAGNNISSAQPHRGYTGHEMLEEMSIVHMNGRLYDPRLGHVMSIDPIASLGPGFPALERRRFEDGLILPNAC